MARCHAPILFIAVALTLVAAALGCAVPPYGCSKDFCRSLRSPPAVAKPQFNKDLAVTWDTRLGYWMGLYNKRYSRREKEVLLHEKGGPSINYESFSEIGYVLKYSTATSLRACCDECRVTTGCWIYQYFDYESASGRPNPTGFRKGVRCYLLKGGRDTSDDWSGHGTPQSGKYSDQVIPGDAYSPKYNPSWVGGLCNGNASVVDDPHFTGAQGTPFDFNGGGALDKSFCLATDRRLHVNIVLKGYRDDAAVAADGGAIAGSSNVEATPPVRSWIKEIGVVWAEGEGKSAKLHSLHLVARNGKRQERGIDGYLAAARLDTDPVPVPRLEDGSDAVRVGGLTLAFMGAGKTGPYEVERFALRVEGLLDAVLSLRVAHPRLQRPDDAEAHFNVAVNDIVATDAVHGVLGQTYRATRDQQLRALKYSEMARLLHGRVAADGATGKGFLDGAPKDYETSGVLATDCKFSAFNV